MSRIAVAFTLLCLAVAQACPGSPCMLDTTFPETALNAKATTLAQSARGSSIVAISNVLSGITNVYFTVAPCESIPLHFHPRATEFFFVLEGTIYTVLEFENNTNYLTNTAAGYATTFPSGLHHFAQNLQCTTAKAMASFACPNPGTAFVPFYVDAYPSNVVTNQFQGPMPKAAITPDNLFAVDQACLAKCGGSPTYASPTQTYSPPTPTYVSPTPTQTYSPPTPTYVSPSVTYSPPVY